MKKCTRFVGLDVHAATIAVAVADVGGDVRSLGTIPNEDTAICKMLRELGPRGALRVCYEAGPCGYVLYWLLTKLGIHCDVIAPSLIPTRAGDRVKTDRRDAMKLARCYRAGDLTPVWVPDAEHEALRDLVRCREAAKKDQLRARHRLSKFLLRHGRRAPQGVKAWSAKHHVWLSHLHFEQEAQQAVFLDYFHELEHVGERIARLERAMDRAVEAAPEEIRSVVEALQALRGVAKLTAVSIVAEVGKLSRFDKPSQLMGYSGLVPREHSSGSRRSQGSITKTGNAHLRRVLVESAWSCRYRPHRAYRLRKRQENVSEEVKEISWRAQERLHSKYLRMLGRGKSKQETVTAVARELLGFVWAIGVSVENPQAA